MQRTIRKTRDGRYKWFVSRGRGYVSHGIEDTFTAALHAQNEALSSLDLASKVRARLAMLGIASVSEAAQAIGWSPQRLRQAIVAENPQTRTIMLVACVCAVSTSVMFEDVAAIVSAPLPEFDHLAKLAAWFDRRGCIPSWEQLCGWDPNVPDDVVLSDEIMDGDEFEEEAADDFLA